MAEVSNARVAQKERDAKVRELVNSIGNTASVDAADKALEHIATVGRQPIAARAIKRAGLVGRAVDLYKIGEADDKVGQAVEAGGAFLGGLAGGAAGGVLGPGGAFVGGVAGSEAGGRLAKHVYDNRERIQRFYSDPKEIQRSLVRAAIRGWGGGQTDQRVRGTLLGPLRH